MYRELLIQLLERYFDGQAWDYELAQYDSAEEFLKKPDANIVFLDLEMGEVNGIEAKNILQEYQKDIKIRPPRKPPQAARFAGGTLRYARQENKFSDRA